MGVRVKGGMWCPQHGEVLAQANFSAFGSKKDNWRCPHCGGLVWGWLSRKLNIAPAPTAPAAEAPHAAPVADAAGKECWAPACIEPIAPGEIYYCEAHRK